MRVKLKEICTKITDGSHFSPMDNENGYPMLSIQDMSTNGFDYSKCKHISQSDYDTLVKNGCKPEQNDVLIAKDGSYLKEIFVVKESKEEVILSSIAILRPDINIVNPCFLKYYLSTERIKNEVSKKYVSGSVLKRIILKNFENIEIDLPDRKTQDKIVEILSGIDNQIEHNNIMAKKLQVLGSTTYGKELRSAKSFKSIDSSEIKIGKEDANFATINGKYNFFTCSENTFLCDEFAFEGKSILIAGNGNFNVKFSDGQFNAYQRVYVISNDKEYGNLYYTCLHNIRTLSQKSNGSIIKFLTLDMLKNIVVPIFDDNINNLLNNVVLKIHKTNIQTKKLVNLKESLLPLLINGQLHFINKVEEV